MRPPPFPAKKRIINKNKYAEVAAADAISASSTDWVQHSVLFLSPCMMIRTFKSEVHIRRITRKTPLKAELIPHKNTVVFCIIADDTAAAPLKDC